MATSEYSETHDLITALRHPIRREILREMDGAEPISPRELAEQLDQPLGNVSYHVRVLVACRAITLIRTQQVRGSTQHFYRSAVKTGWARAALGDEGEEG